MNSYYYKQHFASGAAAWNDNLNTQFGLKWLDAFAKGHGKPITIPEWGTDAPDAQAAEWIKLVMAHFRQWAALESYAYYEEGTCGLADGKRPLAAAALKAGVAAMSGAVVPPVVTPPVVTPPVVPPPVVQPPSAEVVELKAALQAAQDALALSNRRLEAIKAALV